MLEFPATQFLVGAVATPDRLDMLQMKARMLIALVGKEKARELLQERLVVQRKLEAAYSRPDDYEFAFTNAGLALT